MSNESERIDTFIKFTPEVLKRFKAAYEKAVEDGAEEFDAEGKQWVTDYAKYVIAYVEGAFLAQDMSGREKIVLPIKKS